MSKGQSRKDLAHSPLPLPLPFGYAGFCLRISGFLSFCERSNLPAPAIHPGMEGACVVSQEC